MAEDFCFRFVLVGLSVSDGVLVYLAAGGGVALCGGNTIHIRLWRAGWRAVMNGSHEQSEPFVFWFAFGVRDRDRDCK